MNKKAVDWSNVFPKLIIGSIIIIILLVFNGKLGAQTIDTTNKKVCKDSVIQHERLHFADVDISSDIRCPTQNLTIKKKTDEKELIAEAMYHTWDVFLQGKGNLFGDDGTYCHVNYIINFEDANQQINDFPMYLGTKLVPGKQISYSDYFMNFEAPSADKYLHQIKDHPRVNDQIIYGNKIYTVLFVYAKGKSAIENLEVAFGQREVLIGAGYLSSGAAVLIIGGPAGWIIGGTVGIATAVSTYLTNDDPDWLAFTVLREYNADELDKLDCKEMPVAQA